MFRFICFFLFISLFPFGLQAQNSLTSLQIIGTVEDPISQAIEYASISVKDLNGNLLSGAVTNDKGSFAVEITRTDSFSIEISYFGTETYKKEILSAIDSKKYDLGKITLQESSLELNEIVLTAEKSTYITKANKKIFNVGKDVLASSNSTNDLLDQVPSVTVSPEGSVSLRGNSSVQILINGKRSGLTLNNGIDQIAPDNIDRVEVITSPSSKMDASGSGGIINIILKRKVGEGWNGQVRLTAGVPANHIMQPGVNYTSEKLNFFSNFRWRYSDYNGIYNLDQSFKNPLILTRLEKREIEKRHDDGLSAYGGLDYNLTDNQSITFAYFRNQTKDTDFTDLDYTFFTNENLEGDEINRQGNSLENRAYNQLELSYKLTDKFKNKLQVDFQFDFWDSNKTWDLQSEKYPALEQFAENLRTNNIAGSRDYMLRVDYDWKLKEHIKMELGAKLEDRTVSNKYLAETQDENGSWLTFQAIDNSFTYDEQIGAAYVNFSHEINKWSYNAGLRTELTVIGIENEIESTKPYNYINLFPSASISYNFSETHTLYSSYSKRIARPNLWQLYPFYEIRDFNIQEIGNPNLRPSFTDNLELGYNGTIGKLRLSSAIFYKNTQEHITDFISRNDFDVLVIRPVNIDSHEEVGFEINGQIKPSKWLQLQANGQILQFDTQGAYEGTDLSAKGYNWFGRISMITNLPSNFRLQNRFQYIGPYTNAIYEVKPNYDWTITLSKSFMNDNLNINLRAMNVMDSRIQRTIGNTTTSTFNQSRRRTGRRFQVSVVYKINQTKKQGLRWQNRGNR